MPGSLMISFREPTLTGIVEKLEIPIVKEDGREFLAIESMGVFRALAEVLENLVKNQDDEEAAHLAKRLTPTLLRCEHFAAAIIAKNPDLAESVENAAPAGLVAGGYVWTMKKRQVNFKDVIRTIMDGVQVRNALISPEAALEVVQEAENAAEATEVQIQQPSAEEAQLDDGTLIPTPRLGGPRTRKKR